MDLKIECDDCEGTGYVTAKEYKTGNTVKFKCEVCDGDGYVFVEGIEPKEEIKDETWRTMRYGSDSKGTEGCFAEISQVHNRVFIWENGEIIANYNIDGEVKNE